MRCVVATSLIALSIATAAAQSEHRRPQGNITCPANMLSQDFQTRGAKALQNVSKQIDAGHLRPTLKEITSSFVNFLLDHHAMVRGDSRWNIIAANNNAYRHDKSPSMAQACFPGIEKLYSRHYERMLAIEQKQKTEREVERTKPETKLRELYGLYLDVKACYEARDGFLIVIINDVQMQNARRHIKEKEADALKADTNLDPTAIWKAASEGFKNSPVNIGLTTVRLGSSDNFAVTKALCVSSYQALVGHDQIGIPKKDF